MVVAIAVVGDLFADNAAATVLSRLMLVLGVAPVVAPSLGAAVLLHGVVALGLHRAGDVGGRAASGGGARAARDAAAVAPQAVAGARHRRDLCRTAARQAVRHPRAGRRARHVGSVRLHRGGGVRAAGQLRARPAGLRAGVRRGRGRVDRGDAVQRRAAEAVLTADDHAVGAGRGAAGGRGLRRHCPWPLSVGWPVSSRRCGRSSARWASSSPTRPPSRCPGIPMPQEPRPRCSAPRSSASAPRWLRWSACSETTSSRWPS